MPHPRSLRRRPRARVTVSVDPDLLEVVDTFLDAHPELDRGKLFDEALFLWHTLLQADAREERLRAPDTAVEPTERTTYRFMPVPADVHLTTPV